jgi:voltage-gated potassium channel
MAHAPRPPRRRRKTDMPMPSMPPDSGATPRLSLALILVASVIAAGTVGFTEVEGWGAWRAFYFTLTTITTVGYGDEGLSDKGQIVAAALLVGGVLSASYALGVIVQSSVATQLAWRRRMQKKISRLKNHTIVCGFGRMGLSVSKRLAARGVPFVVIEQDSDRLSRALELGYLTVQGNATEEEFLIAACVAHASHIVAAVDNVAENILITMESRELAPTAMIIARGERDEDIRKLKRAGVDRVLCPFKSGGGDVADYITRPKVADFLAKASMGGSGIALAEIRIEQGSGLIGQSLSEMGKSIANRISFVALESKGKPVQVPPRGDNQLGEGDLLIVAGDPDQVTMLNDCACQSNMAA